MNHPNIPLKPHLMLAMIVLLLLPSASAAASINVVPKQSQEQAQAQNPAMAQAWVTPRGGLPFFVIGANYEGPTDHAWMMWEPDKFNAASIEQDFARAHSVGINTLRIFVQKPLRDDINRGDFSKLDAVTSLARRYNVWLILTFTDWAEPDLVRAADLNRKIAEHLASEPSILAYDVKNEPQFTDIAGATFPQGTTVPLQVPDLISQYGEPVKRADIGTYRRSSSIIPGRMTDDQAYMMANYYEIFRNFLNAGSDWVGTHSGTTTLDFMDSPDSASWQPFLQALDTTLLAWNNAQVDVVRVADPGRSITVGYSNVVFAKLPSNRTLDFQSVHRFTSHGYSGLRATLLVLDNLQCTFYPSPVLLEEFGYPGEVKSGSGTQGFDPRTTANLEGAIWAYLYSRGFAGGAKWMLNNFPQGYDPAQNSFGLFDNSGRPKITAHTLREISLLINTTDPGQFTDLRAESNSAVSYSYTASDALIVGGRVYTGTHVTYASTAPSGFILRADGGALSLFASDNATATLYLPGLFGVATADLGRVTLTGLDPQGQPWTPAVPSLNGDWLTVTLRALYSYKLTVAPGAFSPAEAAPAVDTVYFAQTAHNLGGEFLKYWQTNGGLSIFGYPISEAFNERGATVQYFERNRFELHPENQPPYNVLLGRLGSDAVVGRTFSQVDPFDSVPDHRYFPETGHSLSYAFLGYWERKGGLAVFGFPISEELREVSLTDGKEYTVEYFERARFEYHPEYRGSDAEVLLGLLGVTTVKARGWLP